MSRRSKRRRKQKLSRQVPISSVVPAQDEKKDKGPPTTESNKESGDGKIKLTIGIIVVFLAVNVGVAILVNHFSVNPLALYVSAFILCAFIVWRTYLMLKVRWLLVPLYLLILGGTHKYVQNELNKTAKPTATISPLVLQLNTSLAPNHVLDLTNDFLIFKKEMPQLSGTNGHLILPVFFTNEPILGLEFMVNLGLEFRIKNNSSSVVIDSPRCFMILPDSVRPTFSSGWTKGRTSFAFGDQTEFQPVSRYS